MTPWAIQSWVKGGLLPRLRYERPSFGVRVPEGLAAIEGQLIALCRLRYESKIRSHTELALALWSMGWPVDEGIVRKSFELYLAPLAALTETALRADFADRAVRTGNLPARWRQDERTKTALALETLFALASGARSLHPADAEDLVHLERVSHLDRARRDGVGDVGPWLPTAPGAGLAQGAQGMAVPRITEAINHASFAELRLARDRAQILGTYLGVAMPMLEMAAGQDFAGLGAIADGVSDPRFAIMVALVALVLPGESAEMIDLLPDGEVLTEWQSALDDGRHMLDEDPHLAARATSVGLVAALAERQGHGGGG